MSKEKQIIEIKECIDFVYGADCAYYGVDGFAIANEIYNAGYRKQSEGEWISVEDRLPDAIDDYIVVVKTKWPWEKEWEYDVDVATYDPTKDGYIEHWDTLCDWKEGQECRITHWRPFPELPKVEGGE
jgi:hypothetical protein